MTPYQYTYLNFLNGKTNKAHKKFENDYWGASLKELLKTSYFKENKINKVSICGANPDIVKKYIHKTGHINITFTKPEESNYIIMTNRVIKKTENPINTTDLTNCFEKFPGKNIIEVKKNGLVLSSVRKINYNL